MRKLAIALMLALTIPAGAAPAKPKTAGEKLAKARAKANKATSSARKAITRADTAIERCEQALVELCQVEHGVSGGACEDAALKAQFAACHEPGRAPGWNARGRAKTPTKAQRAAYEECLDEVDTTDEDAAAERCAGELE